MEIPWVIEEPARIKHQLLINYIETWMAILFNNQERTRAPQSLLYFDGFSGPGIYYENNKKSSTCKGSPLLVAETANKFIDANPERRVNIICSDSNIKCVDMLNGLFKEANKHNQYWEAYHSNFDEAVNDVLDVIEEEKLSMPPMFFFIDPFGYSGFPMSTLRRIMKYPMAELFINFMIYDIIRFCEEESFSHRMDELFGNNEYKDIKNCRTKEEKQFFLVNLYCNNISKFTKANYVMPFRINTPNQGKRPKYYLIHASKHIKALKAMKDHMAKISDAPYRFEAIGITRQQGFFEDPNRKAIREIIKAYCKENQNNPLDYSSIEEWAYVNTPGYYKTIKEALLILEREGTIKINRKPKQHRTTVTPGAKIIYNEK